jgi:23S rRNA G2445 N2-methylase RlmL
MPLFIATTQKGLGATLAEEIKTLGGRVVKSNDRQVQFEGSWKVCYRVNMGCSVASRILLSIMDFNVYKPDDLYHHLQQHDFTKYIRPDQTLNVSAKVSGSHAYRDQRFLAQKTKDAIVDQFTDKYDQRPNVDNENPTLTIVIRLKETKASVALDTSGIPLFQRGYRRQQADASMKEHLASGIVRASNWNRKNNLYDPMCGAGTILIEAARWAKNMYPGLHRRFSFEHWKIFQHDAYEEVFKDLRAQEAPTDLRFFGFDIDSRVIDLARENAVAAGVDDIVTFKHLSIKDLTVFEDKATIITNPPYGARLGNVEDLMGFYSELGEIFYKFKNWDLWILSGNKDLPAKMRLKAEHRMPVWNSEIECKLLHYPIY